MRVLKYGDRSIIALLFSWTVLFPRTPPTAASAAGGAALSLSATLLVLLASSAIPGWMLLSFSSDADMVPVDLYCILGVGRGILLCSMPRRLKSMQNYKLDIHMLRFFLGLLSGLY